MKKLILIMLTISTLSACGQVNKNSNCNTIPISDWTVIQTNVSVRQEQNTSSNKLGTLKQFEAVNVLSKGKKDVLNGKEDFWYKVGYKKGESGWIFGFYTSLKLEGQKTEILFFEDASCGDLCHLTFYNDNNTLDFGSAINNLCGYELSMTDNFDSEIPNPRYVGKKFKIIYNKVLAKTYCNVPDNYDVCIEKINTIIKLEILE